MTKNKDPKISIFIKLRLAFKNFINRPDPRTHMLQLAVDGKDKVIGKLEEKVDTMTRQYQNLEKEGKTLQEQTLNRERVILFQTFEPLLNQIIMMEDYINKGGEVPQDSLISLLNKIPNVLKNMGIIQFVEIGTLTMFDPSIHTPVVSEIGEIEPGDEVITTVPGFKYKEEILKKAEVKNVKTI
jgi:molecular chaperone GrpE (heat shock protein)